MTLDGRRYAAILRFCVEDLLQGLCQLAYLCKRWRGLSAWSRLYTTFSIMLGWAVSLGTPLYEAPEIRRAYQAVESVKKFINNESTPGRQGATEGVPSGEEQTPLLLPRNSEIHVPFADDVRISTLLLWSATLLFPITLYDSFQCDISTPPMLSFQVFVGAFVFHLFAQTLVIARETNWLRETSRLTLLKVAFFMFLGVLDVFNDVVFAFTIAHCDPISWLSWHADISRDTPVEVVFNQTIPHTPIELIFNQTFHVLLPGEVHIPKTRVDFPHGVTLQHLVLFVLIVGVGICQALPGIVMVFQRNDPFVASLVMKVNEMGLLLAATAAGEQIG